jgi:DNA modification methylase
MSSRKTEADLSRLDLRRDMKIVLRSRKALIPYAKNARTHSEAQLKQIAGSMSEFGWTNPVLLDENDGIIAGHGRILAAELLKLDDIPCVILPGLSPTQRQALVLADNKLALNAGWDNDTLLQELGELSEEGFDLDVVGFNEDELTALLHGVGLGDGLTDPDDAPEPPEKPTSVPGDVWLLGRHRLVCGDCTDPLVVEKALGGVKPHLMVTDPPYGIEFDPDKRNRMLKDHAHRALGEIRNDDRADWTEAWALFPGDVAYVWHAPTKYPVVFESLEASNLILRAQIVWSKSRFSVSPGHYHWQHELCCYCVRKSATAHWSGDKSQTTVWQIDSNRRSETGHSSQKPIECMQRPIENSSSPGHAVYDPFLGSGTTLLAAERTGRTCHSIEINPAYVDVAVRRWQDHVGKTAFLEADGQSFYDVAKERDPASDV